MEKAMTTQNLELAIARELDRFTRENPDQMVTGITVKWVVWEERLRSHYTVKVDTDDFPETRLMW